MDTIRGVLDRARWAPSGDNQQPYRFEILSETEVRVHGFDTRAHCVYDLDGMPSRLAHGTLIETIAIAASTYGLSVSVEYELGANEACPCYRVRFAATQQPRNPLEQLIERRATQRSCLHAGGFDAAARARLERVASEAGAQVLWFDTPRMRCLFACLLYKSAWIRLVSEEAFDVHQRVVEWGARFSTDRIPDRALGLDPLTRRISRWAMKDWARARFMNRLMVGNIAPRIAMDFLPGLFCATHFVLLAPAALDSVQKEVEAGRLLQRFWLNVTDLGLYLQPEMTPLIFSRYASSGRAFTRCAAARERAKSVLDEFSQRLPEGALSRACFVGRIGAGRAPSSRSLRKPLEAFVL